MIRIRLRESADADVAIVGAGPGGAAAACHLARAGFRVVLLDQRRFPRDKVCGDFVGPAAIAEIEHLGLLSLPVFRDGNPIRRAALYLDGVKLIAQAVPQFPGLPDHGLCLPRVVLDNVILRHAVASGARLLEEARVTGYRVEPGIVAVTYQNRSGEHQIKTRLLIGADGSSSLISRLLRGVPPPRRDRIVAVRAYFEAVEGPQDQADLYFSASTFPGYCWVFPTGGTSANVGVGTLLETWPPTKHLQLNQLLTGIIAADTALGFRLSTARLVGKIAGWPLTTFNPHLPIHGDRVILIGDAAGLINPLNGEGIQYALQSARWVAETLTSKLQRDSLAATDLAPYAGRVRHELRYDMAVARLIIDLISNRTLNPIWLQALRIITRRAAFDPGYARLAGAILAGIAPAREALSYRILWGTLQHAAMHTGYTVALDALHGPGRVLRTGFDAARMAASMAVESALRPTSSLNWGLNCALSAIELVTQATGSALEPRPAARVDR
ncbi:MAG: geranylgeranyl reductase family protein [Terriglobia bacterium]